MKEKLKNYNIPVLIIALLFLTGTCGYLTSDQKLLSADRKKKEEVTKETEKVEPIDTVVEIKEIDHSNINGYWESEPTKEGAYLHFDISYPDVINFDENKGYIERSDNSRFIYTLFLKDTKDYVKFYISDLNGDSATIWYADDNGKYINSLALNRKAKEEKEDSQEVNEAPSQNDSSKPSASSKPTTANNKPSSNTTVSNKPAASNSSTNNSSSSSSSSSSKKGHYEERQVCVQDAYDEQVLVKKGACTNVLIQEAYDTQEMVYLDGAFYGPDTEERAWCYICEHFYDDHCQLEGHPCNNKTVELTEPYWHNVDYRTVHHDAVYETRCEPDEYKTVHHDAVYETQKVWVED